MAGSELIIHFYSVLPTFGNSKWSTSAFIR
jgi:hypothetical protein